MTQRPVEQVAISHCLNIRFKDIASAYAIQLRHHNVVTIHDGIVMKSKLGMKARHPGGKKPFVEEVTGGDFHRETAKWMNLSRVYDREEDLYKEIVTDPITGEVVHECIEPLSKHTGHGSAKYKRKTKG